VRFRVNATVRTLGGETKGEYGPFAQRGDAERCVVALAARPDVTQALIVPDESETPPAQ
jgi:hypothetical protein